MFVQDILRSIGSPKAKTDFLAGENGAVKLAKEQIASLEEFARVVRPSRRQHESEDEFAKVLQESAEHFMSVIEGKGKKVQGCKSTYKDLKDLLDKIKTTGYFNGKSLKEEKTAEEGSNDSVDGAGVSKPKEEGSRKSKNAENGKQEKRHRHRKGSKDEKVQNNFDQEPEKKPVEDGNSYQAQEATSPPKPTEDQVAPNKAVANGILSQPPQYGNGHPAAAAAADNAQFNFLQDSQIDMESPHMDPAVVVVQHTAPHPPHHHLNNHVTSVAGPANGGPVPVTTHQQMMAQPPPQPSIQTAFSNHQIILATPPTTLAAMQQAHAAYAFQHQQQLLQQEQAPNQHPVANQPPLSQEVPSTQERPLDDVETPPAQQQKSQDEEQMPKAPKKRPEPAQAKPTGYAAIAAAGFHRQEAAQQKVQQDTMVSIDDWKNEDANDQQQSGGDGFHQGGPRRGGGGRYNGDNRGRGRGGHRGRGGNGGGRGNKDGGNRGRGGKREFRGGRGGAERGGTRGGRGANGFHNEQKAN